MNETKLNTIDPTIQAGHNIGRETAGNISATIQGLNQKLQALAIATSLALSPMACSKSENKDTAGKDENPTEQTSKGNEVAKSETPTSTESASTGGLEAKETQDLEKIMYNNLLKYSQERKGGTIGSQIGMSIQEAKKEQNYYKATDKQTEGAIMSIVSSIMKGYPEFSKEERIKTMEALATLSSIDGKGTYNFYFNTIYFAKDKAGKKYIFLKYKKTGKQEAIFIWDLTTGEGEKLEKPESNYQKI